MHLVSLVHSEAAVQAGVQMCYAHNLLVAPEPDPFWAGSVQGFRRLSEWELGLFSEHVDWASIQVGLPWHAVVWSHEVRGVGVVWWHHRDKYTVKYSK